MPDNRQALPAQTKKKRMNMNRLTIAKQTKARIQPKPNKQTVKIAESNYAIKRKKLIKTVNATVHRVIMSGLADIISTQFHNVIVVPTIEYRRSKNKVVHTTQDINVSIKSTLFENIPAPILSYTRWCDRSATSCLISAAIGFII